MNSATTFEISSVSAAATQAFGRRLGQCLLSHQSRWPLALELIGDLGAGKTTLVQGLAVGLGSVGQVTSPTFTINRSYELSGGYRLEHFDLYRLGELGVMGAELAEALADKQALTVIEWPQQSERQLPPDRLVINLTAIGESLRRLEVNALGGNTATIVKELVA